MRQEFLDGYVARTQAARAARARGSILYLHGLGESSYCFEDIIRHPGLTEREHLAPDLVGFGKTPPEGSPLSLAEHADRIAAWVQKRADEVAVLGHSMGGVIGLLLCERHPELCIAFINVEGNVSWGDCTLSADAWKCTLPEFRLDGFKAIHEEVEGRAKTNVVWKRYLASLRDCDLETFHRNAGELVRFSMGETCARRLRHVSDHIPVLYIGGATGGVAPRSVELLKEAGVSLELIENAHHWPFLDQPNRFIEILLSALPG